MPPSPIPGRVHSVLFCYNPLILVSLTAVSRSADETSGIQSVSYHEGYAVSTIGFVVPQHLSASQMLTYWCGLLNRKQI
jgi:hypothetical protein